MILNLLHRIVLVIEFIDISFQCIVHFLYLHPIFVCFVLQKGTAVI